MEQTAQRAELSTQYERSDAPGTRKGNSFRIIGSKLLSLRSRFAKIVRLAPTTNILQRNHSTANVTKLRSSTANHDHDHVARQVPGITSPQDDIKAFTPSTFYGANASLASPGSANPPQSTSRVPPPCSSDEIKQNTRYLSESAVMDSPQDVAQLMRTDTPLPMVALSAHRVRGGAGSPLSITGASFATSSRNTYHAREKEPDLAGLVRLVRSNVYDGPYSTVHFGIYRNGDRDQPVAIKCVRGGNSRAIMRRFHREVRIQMRLDHVNVLPLYGISRSFGPNGAIITPWCVNDNAERYIKKYRPSFAERYSLWRRVVAGLAYLHGYNPQIVHGDMKPPNILIADDGEPMICDLGLSRIICDDHPSSTRDADQMDLTGLNTTTLHPGTARYIAPERADLENPAEPTTASDVYAVGCIGFEFIYSEYPYAHRIQNGQGQIMNDIRAGIPPARRPRNATRQASPPTLASALSSSIGFGTGVVQDGAVVDAPMVEEDGIPLLWDIFEWCWNPDPSRRPSAQDLHDYLDVQEDYIVRSLNMEHGGR